MTTGERYRRGGSGRRALPIFMISLLVGAFISPLAPTASSQEGEFVTGSGRSDARVIRFGPSSGQLSLAPSAGLALADFLGTVGRGEARPYDFAALEGTMEDLDDDYFEHNLYNNVWPTTRVESTDEGSADGVREQAPPFTKYAEADDTPRGFAENKLASFEVPGLLEVSAGRARAWAVVVESEEYREAGGSVAIGEMTLFDQIVLNGLRWEVRQRTDIDGNPEVTGSFVIGSAEVDGQTFDGPIGGPELDTLFSAINQALAPTGFRLSAPELEDEAGNARISPLGFHIVDSQLGNMILAPILAELQPLREATFDPFLEECLDCAPLVLVADVLVGVFSGAGRFDVEFGGAFAFTEGERFENPFVLGAGATFDDPPQTETIPGIDAIPPQVIEELLPGETTTTAPEEVAVIRDQAFTSPTPHEPPTAASVLWALAVVGLATALGMGAAKYRRLRLERLGLPT